MQQGKYFKTHTYTDKKKHSYNHKTHTFLKFPKQRQPDFTNIANLCYSTCDLHLCSTLYSSLRWPTSKWVIWPGDGPYLPSWPWEAHCLVERAYYRPDERGSVCVCMWGDEGVRETETECVCVRLHGSECVCLCLCVSVCRKQAWQANGCLAWEILSDYANLDNVSFCRGFSSCQMCTPANDEYNLSDQRRREGAAREHLMCFRC